MEENLREAIIKFEEISQQIADLLSQHIENEKECLKVKFPRRIIRSLDSHYHRWPYLSDDRKRTVACTIQLCDVNRWHLNLWEIGLTAGTMWEWHCSLPVIAVIETLMYEYVCQYQLSNGNITFKKTINALHCNGIISDNLKDQMHSLRKYRNDIHLYLREKVEMYEGKPRKYNDAIRGLQNLETELTTHFLNNPIS